MHWLVCSALIATFSVSLSGCASAPQTPEQLAKSHVRTAQAQAKIGDTKRAFLYVNAAADVAGYEGFLVEAFEKTPEIKTLYIQESLKAIATASWPREITEILARKDRLVELGALDRALGDMIQQTAVERALDANMDGSLPFLLVHDLTPYGFTADDMRPILIRTITEQKKWHQDGNNEAIFAYVSQPGIPVEHRKIVEDSLDGLHLKKEELDFAVKSYPKFAERRGEFLERTSEDVTAVQIIRKSVWGELSEATRAAIERNYRVAIAPDANYGLIGDVQTIDKSKSGSNAGSVIGSGVAEIAYIDRSFSNNSYSPWSHIGFGVLGAILGSTADQAPQSSFHHHYTVRLMDGEVRQINQVTGSPVRIGLGACVKVLNLDPAPQKLCEETAPQLEKRLLGLPV